MQLNLSAELSAKRRRDYRCELARQPRDRAAAEALTDHVYQHKLGLSKPTAATPATSQEVVLLVRLGDRPVATMTLQSPVFDPHSNQAACLELEDSYVLETLAIARDQLAEVRRMAVESGHPGAVQCLYAAATELSLAHDVQHWIGLVEAHGELPSDAPLVHRVLDAHDLLARPLTLRPRGDTTLFDEHLAPRRSAFAAEQLKRLPVPQRIRAFARLFHARAVSVPSRHPRYARIAVPMLASVSEFRSQWLR
jgi:hypothetical protein